MPKNHRVEVLCTANELERIRNNAHAKGFPTVSAFVRELALRNPLTTEQQVAEIHRAVVRQGIEGIVGYAPRHRQNPNYMPDPIEKPEFEEYGRCYDDNGYG